MYYHFCLFHYVFLLIEKLVIPGPCLVYYRGQRYLPQGFPMGWGGAGCSRDVQWIPGRAPMGTCDFSVIAS